MNVRWSYVLETNLRIELRAARRIVRAVGGIAVRITLDQAYDDAETRAAYSRLFTTDRMQAWPTCQISSLRVRPLAGSRALTQRQKVTEKVF